MALNFLLKRSGTASKRPIAASMALGEVDINYNASTGGLFYKDSAGSVVKVGPAEVGSSAPNSSPVGSAGNSVGEFWYDTANSVLKIWNGSSWVETVSTSGFLSTSGGSMTGNLYISNCELQVDSSGTFTSIGTATFSGTTELNGATSFFFTPTWLENIGPASQVTYDNTASGLIATEVQGAIDELDTNVEAAQATADAAVPDSTFTALGDLIVGTGASTYDNLVVGANGTVLSANSACALGVEWIAAGGGSGTVTDITAGTGLTGGTITTSGTISLDATCVIAPSILTAKGDIISASAASTPTALAVGTNGQVLYACSTTASGLCWAAPTVAEATATTLGSVYGVWDSPKDNLGYGLCALRSATTGSSLNSAFGSCTLCLVNTGQRNTAFGANVGKALQTGARNTLVGAFVGGSLVTTCDNTFIGATAGFVNTGGCNTFVGSGAGDATVATSCGVAIGWNALGAAHNQSGTTAVGACALFAVTTGLGNVALGFQAGDSVTTGGGNTFLGYTAGEAVTTGSNNTIIGDISGTAALTNNLILAAGTTQKLQVNENGAVGVGSTPSYGNAGDTLQSGGTGAAPTWVTGATGTFTSQDGKTITVTNGIITSIV